MINKILIKARQFSQKNFINEPVKQGLFYSAGRNNIGDCLAPWLVEKVSGKTFPYSNPLERRGEHLFAVGSILSAATDDCVIWGSGFIRENDKIKKRPRIISAVRGPLTAERLRTLGVSVPKKIYGDPAILVPLFMPTIRSIDDRPIGLIPHYVDKDAIRRAKLFSCKRAKIIDIETDDLGSFVRDLMTCELVVSSSLHGVILAEAFGIPAIWAKFDDRVVGGEFKFLDYFRSTGRDPRVEDFYNLTEKSLSSVILPLPDIKAQSEDLINEFPSSFKG